LAKNFPEVDVVIVGLGWTGGIQAKELSEKGLKVVALERGAYRTPEEAFTVPHIRDELEYSVRTGLMIDTKVDTLTVRNTINQTALPMRRLGSFLPGTDVGGAGSHWNGHTWRWTDSDLQVRSMYEQRYGKGYIPEDMTIQDWGITYKELEPYYDRFEKTAGISGQAGRVNGKVLPGGNPFEGDRSHPYPLPPLQNSHAGDLFSQVASSMGYHPFPNPAANASRPYTNPDGSRLGACQYCGFCERYGCESNAKGSPNITVIPLALKQPTFEMRTHAWVTQVVTDNTKRKATGVKYTNLNNGEECFQPAGIVLLAAYGLNNVHLMLLSGIGQPYDPVTQKGLVGKNYAYQTGADADLFFEEGHLFNPFMSTGSLSTVIDDFHQNWEFDRATAGGFVGGYTVNGGMFHGRPIEYHPVPPGTPRWGKAWKDAMAKWYNRSMRIGSSGSVMANRYNYLSLDPTYRNALGLPLMRMTFDFKKNEHLISTHASQTIDALVKALKPTRMRAPAPRTGPWSVVPYQSTHNTGGTIMGDNPGNSVVNKYGQSWDVPNLFVLGASLFPHNSAYNPTGPVGALAYHTADAIKTQYLKRPSALVSP
jgi:gluconate 2-dehydrogenase alpha chain